MFPPHPTELLHLLLGGEISAGDFVIDATAGNGHDTCFLARCVGAEGRVLAIDVQPRAIESTGARLESEGLLDRVTLHLGSHADLAAIAGDVRPSAIIFNLGYLPGGDRSIITRATETLTALGAAAEILHPGGILAVVCYTAHAGGEEEGQAVQDFITALPSDVAETRLISDTSSPLPRAGSMPTPLAMPMNMKRLPLLFLLLLCPLHAQEEKEPDAEVENLLPSQKEFLNLPEEERKKFATHFGEAARYFQQKRIFECLEAISEAEKIFSNSAELLNLRGSCYVEMRSFDKAMVAFGEALKINPKNASIRFNVAEVLFVTRQWKEAHDLFAEILKEIPEGNVALSRLVEFKLLLCKTKLGMAEEVIILANKYDYQDDSPYYYYAQAALAYEAEELLQAEEWLGRANRIFRDPNIIAPWQDTLVEYGYIKSFYGDENPGAE